MNSKQFHLHQNIKKWNTFFVLFFVAVGALFFITLLELNKLPRSMGVFDFIILSLATFRLIRLFVYDNIFLFLREAFMDIQNITVNSEENIIFVKSGSSLKRTLYNLLMCPWCLGGWAALCAFFVFYLAPKSYILFLILAASSLASLLQLLSNKIGWRAELAKVKTEKLAEEKD